jgi:hypothetical protein
MIVKKKEFFTGAGLLVVFTVVLVGLFLPLFAGKNALQYLDNLYNSISKGSAYYIPEARAEAARFAGTAIDVTITMENSEQAARTAKLFSAGGAETTVSGANLLVKGDLGKILANCVDDADAMYHNRGASVSEKYGHGERQALYDWWAASKAMDKALTKKKLFKEAKVVALVEKKAVETSYNYYTIKPEKITDRFVLVVLSLVFYVIYTLWYGYAIMYLFEGLGMRLEH